MEQRIIYKRTSAKAFGESVNIVMGVFKKDLNINEHYYCDDKQFYIEIPKVAKYYFVVAQDTLFIEPNSDLKDLQQINTWLYGTVFAYILQSRGYLVLHGSAVLVNDKAIIFSGDSGAGKSTTAAAMVALGYPLITDDVVAIRYNDAGELIIIPGPRKVKLWSDALSLFGYSSNGLRPIASKFDKYEMPVAKYHETEVLISHFFELNHNSDCLEINFIKQNGHNKISTLVKNTYRYEMVRSMMLLARHLQQVSFLASSIDIYQICRPQNQYLLNKLLDEVCKKLKFKN